MKTIKTTRVAASANLAEEFARIALADVLGLSGHTLGWRNYDLLLLEDGRVRVVASLRSTPLISYTLTTTFNESNGSVGEVEIRQAKTILGYRLVEATLTGVQIYPIDLANRARLTRRIGRFLRSWKNHTEIRAGLELLQFDPENAESVLDLIDDKYGVRFQLRFLSDEGCNGRWEFEPCEAVDWSIVLPILVSGPISTYLTRIMLPE